MAMTKAVSARPMTAADQAADVEVFQMPVATYLPLTQAIEGAKHSIDLSVYLLSSPMVTAALKAAVARGVRVRVMLEAQPVGIPKDAFGQTKADLESAGITVESTPPKFDQNHSVDHAKFMLIDGADAWIGSGNLVRSSVGGIDVNGTSDRDYWVEDTRPTTAVELSHVFECDWNRTNTDRMVYQNLVVTPDDANAKLLDLIDQAKQRLFIYNQELQYGPVLDHLIAAKQRGVKVEVLCASPHADGLPDRNAPAVDRLKAAGIDVREFSMLYLHAKAIVSDDRAYIGSQNFSSAALFSNREVGDIFERPDAVQKLAQLFQIDHDSVDWA